MSSGRLCLRERYCIHALHQAHWSMHAIADALDRAPSTISRELRSRASRRPRIDPKAIAQIESQLAEDWSPEPIAATTGLASHEWIFQHIYADQRRGGSLYRALRRRRRRRQHRRRGLGADRKSHVKRRWLEEIT